MDVGVLGPLIVRVDGRETTPGPAKQRALLALLVVHHNEVVPVDTLIDGIWNGRPPATAHKIIQGYISQLRRRLGGDDLQTRPGGYRLQLDPDDLDADRFEALLDRGRGRLTGDPAAAGDLLGQALRLWRGPALAEFGSLDFAVREADRLEQLRLLALEGRIEADIALGRHAAVIPELRALTRGYPLREDLRALLMRALYRAGRQGEALAVYAEARTWLVKELGIEPGEALGRLEHAILVHDPALDPPVHENHAARDPRPLLPVAVAPTPTLRAARPLTARGPRRIRRPRRSFALMTCAAIVAAAVLALVHPGTHGPDAAAASTDSVTFVAAAGPAMTSHIDLSASPTAVAVDGSTVWGGTGGPRRQPDRPRDWIGRPFRSGGSRPKWRHGRRRQRLGGRSRRRHGVTDQSGDRCGDRHDSGRRGPAGAGRRLRFGVGDQR